MSAISISEVAKSFGSVRALAGIDLELADGEFFGLLGPNGAGKTTLMRILSGLLKADGGRLLIAGRDIATWKPSAVLGIVPQEIALYSTLTARDNLELFGAMYGLRGAALRKRCDELLDLVGLLDRARSQVRTFSGGMTRRLNLAAGLLHDPAILLLDEPTVGVDPQSRASIFTMLEALNRVGTTIVYTTHYMEEAERLCRRIGIIDHGRLLADGTLSELLGRVQTAHAIRAYGAISAWPRLEHTELRAADGHADYVTADLTQLGSIVSALERSGARFDRIEIRGPSLEALFLQLTGTELRD
jgi:ABC-2 type transport system ATP-binding protein